MEQEKQTERAEFQVLMDQGRVRSPAQQHPSSHGLQVVRADTQITTAHE